MKDAQITMVVVSILVRTVLMATLVAVYLATI